MQADSTVTQEVYTREELNEHVERILQSEAFKRADTQRKLLLYLWQHRDEEIAEYSVAVEGLGRQADFDPKLDASVRVQISRLRKKLGDYYKDHEGELPYMVEIPMGSYTPRVVDAQAISVAVQEMATPVWAPLRDNPITTSLGIGCLLLSILALVLFVRLRNVQHEFESPNQFWREFMGNSESVRIILPTPTFFTFTGTSNLHVRDVNVNEFSLWAQSPDISQLAKEHGVPSADQAYTVTNDTLAGILLSQYLDRVGAGQKVSFDVSSTSSMSLLEQTNVVALGAHATLQPFKDYLDSMSFSLGPSENWVDNSQVAPGESRRYQKTVEGVGRVIEPSIVAILPGRKPGKKLLIIQSKHTSAVISMLTSMVGDAGITKIWKSHGQPAYFEMVIMTQLQNDKAVKSWPIALHPYAKTAPIE